MRNRQATYFVPLMLAAPLLLALACSGSPSVDEAPVDYETQEVPARWSVANAESLATLARSSDAVFIGTVTGQRAQRSEPLGPAALLGSPAPDDRHPTGSGAQ